MTPFVASRLAYALAMSTVRSFYPVLISFNSYGGWVADTTQQPLRYRAACSAGSSRRSRAVNTCNRLVTADVDFICGHCPSLSERHDVTCCVDGVILCLVAVSRKALFIVIYNLDSGTFCSEKFEVGLK
ncbi:unnamed protein product [Gongylonema pulchrum]|uniref:Secreted protein n=1 Tax=Gongylonema pulchrum TaxID=637853 RepID=A0A183CYW4_9BILA|nr:unnamed protein product [Gongylonema pulchrum]